TRSRPSPLTWRSRTLAIATSNESMPTSIMVVSSCSARAATTTAATALSSASSPLVAAIGRCPAGDGGPGGSATGADCASAGTVARHRAASTPRIHAPGGARVRAWACMRRVLVAMDCARSAFADHVHPGRRRERERAGIEGRIPLPAAELDPGALPERVHDLHPHQPLRVQAEPGGLERGVLPALPWPQHQPLQALGIAQLLNHEIAVQARRVDQRGQRAVLLRPAL